MWRSHRFTRDHIFSHVILKQCHGNFCKGYQQNDHSRITHEFNTYFASVRKIIADKVRELAGENGILISPPEVSKTYNHIISEGMFQLGDVTSNEVRRIILESPSHKAPEPDKKASDF